MHPKSGNFILIDALQKWGINFFTGVNGGAIVYLLQYLEPLNNFTIAANKSYLLSLNEYIAGFVPIGYYLATGKIAACALTTGAATNRS